MNSPTTVSSHNTKFVRKIGNATSNHTSREPKRKTRAKLSALTFQPCSREMRYTEELDLHEPSWARPKGISWVLQWNFFVLAQLFAASYNNIFSVAP